MEATLQFEVALSAESLNRWKIGRDGGIAAPPLPTERVPLSYLVFLRAQPILGVNFHDLLGRDPDRGLYGGVTYRELAPLGLGQTLQASSAVQGRKVVQTQRGELTITTFVTQYACNGTAHASESVRMIDTPPANNDAQSEASSSGGLPAAVREPIHPLLCRIAPITHRQVAWLTVETGDINALHLDAHYAAQRGFPDVVVPATLITALIERELESALGRHPVELDVRYSAPSFPRDAFDLYATVTGDTLLFQALVGTSLRAEGKARLCPGPDMRP